MNMKPNTRIDKMDKDVKLQTVNIYGCCWTAAL